ncbi:hypothetical protein MM239_11980 [Belliella sp. DSM 111904]|uniref:Uncharacterized protein n=1 Tax=Belliella filtrata TaxID=2923435 RepID=A0ABS9V125_9BACT|nr:hypothetical protein [Belliella filtrata]MCH7410117.1 hypothetical protein [Belliella filtrata]
MRSGENPLLNDRLGKTLPVSNRFTEDVIKLSTLFQEIESKLGNSQNLGLSNSLMSENAFSDDQKAIKKCIQMHEMKYQKKRKGSKKKGKGLKKK